MADYYTQAVLATAPLTCVPYHVYRALNALSTNDMDALKRLFYELNDGGALRQSLVTSSILEDVTKLDDDALLRIYEEDSGNKVEDNIILAPEGTTTPYTGALAREHLADYVGLASEEVENACREVNVTRYADGDVYLCWDESFSDGAGLLLQWLLRQLPEEVKYLRVEAANTCSQLRPDGFGGFGGFCVVITREEVHWLHASEAAARVERVVMGAVTSTKDVLTEFGLSERGGAEYLAKFIEQWGLDRELRHFLEKTEVGEGELVLTALMTYQDDLYGRRGEPNKIGTIKAVKHLMNLGLKEAKDLVEALPAYLGEVPDDHEIVQEMRKAGAQFTRKLRKPRKPQVPRD